MLRKVLVFLNKGIRNIVYPVKDLAKSKAMFRNLLGIEPYVDSPFYVGFKFGDYEIGLDPNGHRAGVTVYFNVEDMKQTLDSLSEQGAKIQQDVKEIGGGAATAIVRDADGNLIGLLAPSPTTKPSSKPRIQ